jgi:hypothetical protein
MRQAQLLEISKRYNCSGCLGIHAPVESPVVFDQTAPAGKLFLNAIKGKGPSEYSLSLRREDPRGNGGFDFAGYFNSKARFHAVVCALTN